MARRTSKHGTTYTEGSTQKKGSWFPRDCEVCSERVLARNGFWNFDVRTKIGTALHHGCTRAWFAGLKVVA